MITKGRLLVGTVLAVALGLLTPGLAGAADPYPAVPTPTVSGPLPVTSTSYPFLATDINLKKYGYVEQEFLYTGRAFRYSWPEGSSPSETGTRVEDGGYPFKTRIIVRRPAKAKDFNGVVVAEWMNVTAFHDLEANWFGDPYYLLKNGYAFVGISAQHQGTSVLCCDEVPLLGHKPFNPTRYAGLDVNGGGRFTRDELSYDIYASALKAVRGAGQGARPLGSLPAPKTIVASGESQSCGRLGNQYNRVEPIQDIIDAYLLTVCRGPKLRDDRPEKAIRILSESESYGFQDGGPLGPSDDPDTSSFRKWEVAGGSHLPRLAFNNWNKVVSRDRSPQKVDCAAYPLSLVQWPFSQNRAISDLVRWSRGGAAPQTAPPMEYQGLDLVRDELGHAKGGIRYPEVEVPTGVNSGANQPKGSDLLSRFCRLLGSHEAFPAEKVVELHGSLPDFVRKSGTVADRLVEDGFLLKEDATRLKAIARQYPLLPPGPPKAKVKKQRGRTQVQLTWFGTTAPRTTFVLARARAGQADPAWQVINGSVRGQGITLSREPKGRWVYAVRSKTRVELRDPKTNTSTFPLEETIYSSGSKPVRVP